MRCMCMWGYRLLVYSRLSLALITVIITCLKTRCATHVMRFLCCCANLCCADICCANICCVELCCMASAAWLATTRKESGMAQLP